MKATFIGIGKAAIYIIALLFVLWVLSGFETPTRTDIATLLAIGAITKHFVDREEDKQSK